MELLIFPKIDKLLEAFFSTLFLKKNKNGTNKTQNNFLNILIMEPIS